MNAKIQEKPMLEVEPVIELDLPPEQPMAVESLPSTPMGLLQRAVERGADLATIEKLMDLRDREEASQARKAFVSALAAFKALPLAIFKSKLVDYELKTGGRTKYHHATLDDVASTLSEALGKHGLSFRWKVEQAPSIKVTCYLMHSLGHTESCEMEAPRDDSGSKNPIQAVGSTVTYLQRYTLLAITGTATKDQDADGLVPDMPEEAFQGHLKAIREADTLTILHQVYLVAYKAAGRDKVTQKAIIKAKDERKAELMGVAK